MTWLFAIMVVLVLGGVAVVAAGRAGTLAEPERDHPPMVLPDGPLAGTDLRRVRFPLAVRGYRMADVDALLDRVADQLEQDVALSPQEPDEDGQAAQRLDNDPTQSSDNVADDTASTAHFPPWSRKRSSSGS